MTNNEFYRVLDKSTGKMYYLKDAAARSGGGGGGEGGSLNYNDLLEYTLPTINSVMLKGNKTGTQLALVNSEDTLSESEIDRIIYGGL